MDSDAARMSPRGKSRLLAALRDGIVRLCVAVGGLLGLLGGLERAPGNPPTCERTDPCVGELIVSGMKPVVIATGIGVLTGLAVALLLCSLLRDRTSPHRPERQRWITARYHGRCETCDREVSPGNRVLHSRTARAVTCGGCARA